MEANRRFTTMVFPQGFDGTKIKLNIVLIPRNMDPFAIINTGLAAPRDKTIPFADIQPTFEAGIVRGLDQFPMDNATAPLKIPVKKLLTTTAASNKKKMLQAIEKDFTGRITLTSTDKANEILTTDKVGNSVKKYLPESYRAAFNFTSPRHENAKTDDSYHCVMRDTKKPVVKPPVMDVSWGQLYAHILRQPLLAKACGMIYTTELKVETDWFDKGGYIYVDITTPDYAGIQAPSLEDAGGNFIKRYAARIPKLKAGEKRPVFAPILFPVLHRKVVDVTDPEPQNAPWDDIFAEVNEYNDGFAKIVHANQPVSANLMAEQQDGLHPQKDAGIRIGWDDEQILIWYIRQMTENPNEPGTKKYVDTPLGIYGYRVDVKDETAGTAWASLNLVEATKEYKLNGVSVGNKSKEQLELPYQVYPTQPDGNKNAAYWLPMYYGNWIGKSMVMKDSEAAEIYQNDKAQKNETKIVDGKIEIVSTTPTKADLPQLFKEVKPGTDLKYGNIYKFRIRLMDISGGGPTWEEPEFNPAAAPNTTVHFKRYIAPDTLRLAELTDQPTGTKTIKAFNDREYFNQATDGTFDDAPSIRLGRPLLNYPAVVFTDKYQKAGLDPVKLLKQASIDMAGDSAFGIADPDVTSVEVTVEVETLRMDNAFSKSGTENYATLYVTHRKFAAKFDEEKIIPVQFKDVPVLNLTDHTNPFLDPALTKATLDAMDEIVLPTARRIRLTIRAVCDGDKNYFGHINDDHDLDTRYGKATQLWFYNESQDETNLLLPKENVPALQALYLQPDLPFVNNGNVGTLLLRREVSAIQPDIVQRLASQLGVEAKGLTLVSKKGERVVFACSNRIRHSLAPDHSSITFASKEDLIHHWLGCITYKLNRDWTWNALEDVSFKICRRKKFRHDADAEAEDHNYTKVLNGDPVDEKDYLGDIEIKHTVSFEALQPDTFDIINRDHTTIIFIDAIEPKAGLTNGTDLRFPDEPEVKYLLQPFFKPNHATTAGNTVIKSEEVLLPTTVNPAQVPKVVSVGVAFSTYHRTKKYSSSEPRKKYLWVEFAEPVKDPNDTIFCRVLAYAPDQLISNNHPELFFAPAEPPLPIDPEFIRKITPLQTDDMAGLSAMQPMEKSTDSPLHYLLPLPPGMYAESAELFGFFTYEFRIGHGHWSDRPDNLWSTAQARFGRPLRVTGMQHPAPTLLSAVNRTDKILYVNAPYAQAVFNGKNVTSEPPRTQLWCLLYTQVTQADGKDHRNILISEKKMDWRRKIFDSPEETETRKITMMDMVSVELLKPVDTTKILLPDKATLTAGAKKAIIKDQQRYGTAVWENKEINDLLHMLGLDINSPLSVLVVEVFGNITSFKEHLTDLQKPEVKTNVVNTLRMQGAPTEHINKFNSDMNHAAAEQQMMMMQTSTYSPLSSGLGHYRILRTSPLTEVPFICCTE